MTCWNCGKELTVLSQEWTFYKCPDCETGQVWPLLPSDLVVSASGKFTDKDLVKAGFARSMAEVEYIRSLASPG